MALNEKQKKILFQGGKLKRRTDDDKGIAMLIEENVTGVSLTNLLSAIRAELTNRAEAKKARALSEINDLKV